LASLEKKEGRGKDVVRRDPRGCGGRPARQGEEEKEGGRERLTGEVAVSASAKKRKRERERRAGAGWQAGPAGLGGPKGEQGMVFLFSFSNFFFKPLFFFKFKSNSFKLFLKNL
jgi:hypothetical protein